MTKSLSLLFQNQAATSPLHKEVCSFFKNEPFDLEETLELRSIWHASLSEIETLQNWQTLLSLVLLGTHNRSHLPILSQKVNLLLNQPWNHHSLYLRAIVALNQQLVGLPVLELKLDLLKGGAALIELQEYSPWQSLPYCPHHAELGTILCALAFLTNNEQLKQDVTRLAHWQLNALDANYMPLVGLFVQEKDGALSQQLAWNYLFFHAMAHFLKEEIFDVAAQAQMAYLEQLANRQSLTISPLLPLLEQLITPHVSNLNHLKLELTQQVFDPSTSLVGWRSIDQHAVCTLHGGHTGLGCFRFKDVEVLNYGPQYFPLEECAGFGIEGNHLSEHGLRKSQIHMQPHGFSLKGCVRVVDQPSASNGLFSMGKLRGIWLELEQEFKATQLDIRTQFLGIQGWESVAFSFFVKAKKCQVSATNSLLPATLKRYEGPCQPLILEGERGVIELASTYEGSMQIIPLGSTEDFWGADFLIAYLLDSKQAKYQWRISHSIKKFD
jgi:hypothetical protein